MTKTYLTVRSISVSKNHRYVILKGDYDAPQNQPQANFLLVDVAKLEKNEPCLTLYQALNHYQRMYIP